jgi:hypothetical protein
MEGKLLRVYNLWCIQENFKNFGSVEFLFH